jgi:2-phosphosulfolactate phosphatase
MADVDLSGKILLSSTTNGSRMVVAASSAPIVVMAGFCNSSAVAHFLQERGNNVSLVCSGRLGEPVIEDWLGATWLAHLLDNSGDFELSKDEIRERCRDSPSYDALLAAGLERDFDLCLTFDSLDIVPLLDSDGFVVAKD